MRCDALSLSLINTVGVNADPLTPAPMTGILISTRNLFAIVPFLYQPLISNDRYIWGVGSKYLLRDHALHAIFQFTISDNSSGKFKRLRIISEKDALL